MTHHKDPILLYSGSVFYNSFKELINLEMEGDKALGELFNDGEFASYNAMALSPFSFRGGEGPWEQGRTFRANAYLSLSINDDKEIVGIFHIAKMYEDPNIKPGELVYTIHRLSGDPLLREMLEARIQKAFKQRGFQTRNR